VGRRQRAEEVLGDLRAIAERTGIFRAVAFSASADAVMAVIDGRLEDAIEIAEGLMSRGRQVGVPVFADLHAIVALFRAWSYIGTSTELDRVLSTERTDFVRCWLLSHLGRKEEASEIIQRTVVQRPGIGTAKDETSASLDALLLESSVLVSHRGAAELLLNRLSGSGMVTSGARLPTCIPRHLGGAAALLGRCDEARQHYHEAIRVCTEMRFRPELALSRLQLAELLLDHYPDEKKDALEHLDFAIKEFREMKMQPSLERALRRKEILKA
jgi:tetratricopeptide (TPR) repeat protein